MKRKLLELILTEGFLTDPNMVGVEKLRRVCVAAGARSPVHPTLLRRVRQGMEDEQVMLLITLQGIRELGLEDDIPRQVKALGNCAATPGAPKVVEMILYLTSKKM